MHTAEWGLLLTERETDGCEGGHGELRALVQHGSTHLQLIWRKPGWVAHVVLALVLDASASVSTLAMTRSGVPGGAVAVLGVLIVHGGVRCRLRERQPFVALVFPGPLLPGHANRSGHKIALQGSGCGRGLGRRGGANLGV